MSPIKAKDRDALLQALRTGVVPRVGQHLIQVGRQREIETLLKDLSRLAEGGAAFRLMIGEYGSGKTFFLNLIQSIALEQRLVATRADLTPARRVHATGGQARALSAELMRNLATRTRPEGGALGGIVEKFIATSKTEADAAGVKPEAVITAKLDALTELPNAYDFAQVIGAYWQGFNTGKDRLKSDAVRWLRAEFTTETAARQALGVRAMVDDSGLFSQCKLLARFVRLAGYRGLLVCLDEMVNLYKLANRQAREANYEQILAMLNGTIQGSAEGLGIFLGGTPEFLTDTRRGLFSYSALQSRLAENSFARGGLVDFDGPVLRLSTLTPEEFFVLLQKMRHVYAYGDPAKYLLPDEALQAFMEHCLKRVGEAYFRTPRTTIKAFADLLSVLEQNPTTSWQDLLEQVPVVQDQGCEQDSTIGQEALEHGAAAGCPATTAAETELADFKL